MSDGRAPYIIGVWPSKMTKGTALTVRDVLADGVSFIVGTDGDVYQDNNGRRTLDCYMEEEDAVAVAVAILQRYAPEQLRTTLDDVRADRIAQDAEVACRIKDERGPA